jgi:uncharacterized protein (TIGR02266 family)
VAGGTPGTAAEKPNTCRSNVGVQASSPPLHRACRLLIRDEKALIQDARCSKLEVIEMRSQGTPSRHPAARGDKRQSSRAPAGDERRKYERLSLTAEVGLRSDSNFYTGFSDDLSEGGLFIATYSLLPIGSKIEVSFWLPSGHEIITTAEVRWLRDPRRSDDHGHVSPGMGVRFTALAAEHLSAIREFMDMRPPMFYDDE